MPYDTKTQQNKQGTTVDYLVTVKATPQKKLQLQPVFVSQLYSLDISGP